MTEQRPNHSPGHRPRASKGIKYWTLVCMIAFILVCYGVLVYQLYVWQVRDAESYRAKREESLVRLAEKMAAKAIKYKRSMALEPMNSYERHVIHTALQDYEGVTTSSTGTEPNRRVVVSYEKPQRTSNKPVSREWS